MLQLEFFPRTELKSLMDFKRLEQAPLSIADKKQLISSVDFFYLSRANSVIRRQHSDYVDNLLGMRLKYVEEMLVAEAQAFDPEGSHESWGPALHNGIQTWVGLDRQTLQTPYCEIVHILQLLKIKPYQHIVDLGAAYGRMGVVIGGLYIKNYFTGFEFVKSRTDEGNRIYQELGLNKCKLVPQDLFAKDFILPEADIFFIYDYGQVEHINHTLSQIALVAKKRPVKVVVKGKFTKKIISESHPWLDLKYESKSEELSSVYTAFLTYSE